MALFQYRAADQAGKIVEGVMEAEIEQSVVSRLHEMGCVPLRISPPGGGPGRAQPLALPFFAPADHTTAVAPIHTGTRHVARRRTATRPKPFGPRKPH